MNSQQNQPVAPEVGSKSSNTPGSTPNKNKKIGIFIGAGVLGIGVIVTLILVVVNLFGGSRVVCTSTRSARFYELSEEITARFRGGVMNSVSYTGVMTLDSDSIDRLDSIYESAIEQYGDDDSITITRGSNSMTMSETVYVDDRGNFRGANVNFITFGEGGISRETFIERMERDDYICR